MTSYKQVVIVYRDDHFPTRPRCRDDLSAAPPRYRDELLAAPTPYRDNNFHDCFFKKGQTISVARIFVY